MLQSITLENWKSFGSAPVRIPLAPLTVFVGPNSSGKSNVFEALKFLQGVFLDFFLDDALNGRSEGGRTIWPGIRGRRQGAGYRQSPKFRIEVQLPAAEFGLSTQMVDGTTILEHEWFKPHFGDSIQLNGSFERPPIPQIWPPRLTGWVGSSQFEGSLFRSGLTQLGIPGPKEPAVLHEAHAFLEEIRSVFFSEMVVGNLREPSTVGQRLSVTGSGIPSAIHSMSESDKQVLADWMDELSSTRVSKIGTEIVEKLGSVFLVVDEAHGHQSTGAQLSDGTLHFLGVLVAVMTAKAGSVIVFEEPETGLHPTRIQLLVEFLTQMAAQRGIQVLLTTHSPQLLAALPKQVFCDVVAFDRGSDGSSVAHRVGDLKNVDVLLEEPMKRAHLIATGWLERAV